MKFINSYVQLGDEFYHSNAPSPCSKPSIFLWNNELSNELGIDKYSQNNPKRLAEMFSGNLAIKGAQPLSMAYAGHQFGHFNHQLGDGRAHLLGDLDDINGNRVDIQLKGSGTSAFSRSGDGRCALGPAIREFVISQAMHALGVPTTRCLAVVTTGDPVYRDTVLPGAVVTRVASSHVRVGTFEYFAARGHYDAVEQLADYTIARLFPAINVKGAERFLHLINAALDKQIELITEWMRIGFIHGVMNTDNTAISGETIDYGPCAFMGAYNPQAVYSSIDAQGRYAFGNQPAIAQWNMSRFAECFLPLISDDADAAIGEIRPIFASFPEKFEDAYFKMFAAKLGLQTYSAEDKNLFSDILSSLKDTSSDYTQTFDQLTDSITSTVLSENLDKRFSNWFKRWRERLGAEGKSEQQLQADMRKVNPTVIPRNHHMEAVITQCIAANDPSAAEQFLEVLMHPYENLNNTRFYQDTPEDGDVNYRTFCGT